MNKNETVLLQLIKKSLFGADVSFDENTDWDAVQKEAFIQAVVALAAVSIPESETDKWCELAAQSIAHYIQVLFEQNKLVKLLNDNKIPYIILKGTAAAVYYPTPKLRMMGDIDFMVDPDRYDDTVKLLNQNGYTPETEHDNDRHCGFKRGRISFELHHRYSHEGCDIEPLILEGIKNAVTRKLNDHEFLTLPDYLNGLIILEHITFHIGNETIFRQAIDWAMFVNSVLDDKTYKEDFLPLLESVGLTTFCETLTKMCKMYFGLPNTVTWCDNADQKTASELMQAIIKGAHTDAKRVKKGNKQMQELTFIVKRNGLFRSLQKIGKGNFAICRKNRFFGAFAWLFQAFRFAGRGFAALFSGANLIKDASDGAVKADFYKRLGL